jgi:hypothetical protein
MAYEEEMQCYVDDIGILFDATGLHESLDAFAQVAKQYDLNPAQAAVLFMLDATNKLGVFSASVDLKLETRARLLGADYDAIKTLYYMMLDESKERTREAG